MLTLANQIIKTNPNAIKEFIGLLGRKYQSEHMVKAVSAADVHKVPRLEPHLVWFSESTPLNSNGDTLYSIKKQLNVATKLKLSCSMILPWPWNMDRVVNNLSYIGKDKVRGAWLQDDNHKVEL